MNIKNILLSCVIVFGSISLSGCYTQLAMFHPEPENDDSEEFYPYSVARVRPNLSLYANDGAGTSLGMAYQMMYNRFHRYYGNRYSYYNPYYYGGYYNDYYYGYNISGYTVYIPIAKTKVEDNKPRNWVRGNTTNDRPTSNLRVTRSSQSSNNNSSTSSTRSSSSSSTSSNSGTRVTKRN